MDSLVEKSIFILVIGVMLLPMAIFIKKAFALRGLTWQAYIVAILAYVPLVNIIVFFIARGIVGYKDGLGTYVLAILAPPSVLILSLTSLFFEFPVLEKKRPENYGAQV
jgi:hypothetical protein